MNKNTAKIWSFLLGLTALVLLLLFVIPFFRSSNLVDPEIKNGLVVGQGGGPSANIVPQDTQDLVGKQIQTAGVRAGNVLNDRVFWVVLNADLNTPILVVREQPQSITPQNNIRTGTLVSIIGTILNMPDQQVLENSWNLDQEQINSLKKTKTFIGATQVNIVPENSSLGGY